MPEAVKAALEKQAQEQQAQEPENQPSVDEGTEPTQEPESKPEVKYTDKDVNDILAKQKAKWEKEAEAKVSEAKKLAKMNADEKAQYELQTLQTQLAEREAEINRRELMAAAKDELTTRGLPIELAEMLDYREADTVQTSMAAVEKVFRNAVEKQVNDKLRGTAPSSGGKPKEKSVWDEVASRYKNKEKP